MFKKLVKSVFPSVASDQGFTPDYESFERGRDDQLEEFVSKTTGKKLQPDALPKAGPFYDYLFGNSQQQIDQDPLSLFVAQKINELVMNPEPMLDDLPVMPTSVAKVMSLIDEADFNLPELLKVIEQEPSVAADVIKLANTPKYKRGDREITDLHKAFMCMGAEGLKNGVIQSYVKRFTASSNLYFKQFGEKIWKHSYNSALYSQFLAEKYLPQDEVNTIYLVGLIRNLGAMIIFQLLVEAFKFVDPDAQPNSASFKLLMAEQSLNLTMTIAKYWNLPPKIIDILAAQNKDNKEQVVGALCVYEANIISEAMSLFFGKRINAEIYQKYINAKITRDESKAFALSLLPEPINS